MSEDGCLFVIGLAFVLALVGGVYLWQKHDDRQHAIECARLMTFAHTAHDTLEVQLACSPTSDHDYVMPVTVPVYVH